VTCGIPRLSPHLCHNPYAYLSPPRLVTSPTSTPKTHSQPPPPRPLYHSKRLKDPETKEAFINALAKKVTVSRTTPIIQKLHNEVQGKKIPIQSFADAQTLKSRGSCRCPNTEITWILQKAALEILTIVDPPMLTRATAKNHAQNTTHHKQYSSAQPNFTEMPSTPCEKI